MKLYNITAEPCKLFRWLVSR